jgi:hypothetical protein
MDHSMTDNPRLTEPGSLVRIKSEKEIVATLGPDGTLDRLPFMPEMRKYCGRIFRVYKPATTSCVDTIGARRIDDAVYLEGIRCDGHGHDDCQKLCTVIWKTAWLTEAQATDTVLKSPGFGEPPPPPEMTYRIKEGKVYFCQSTELFKATRPIPLTDLRHYVINILNGQQSLPRLLRELWVRSSSKIRTSLGMDPGLPWGGHLRKTPQESLNLKPGELVEVKSLEEIRATVNPSGKNRGLEFAPEMMKFCGRRFIVLSRVEKIIMETTAEMLPISDTVILEAVACDGCFHRGCARNHYFHWREVWLKRIDLPHKAIDPFATDSPAEIEASSIAHSGKPADCNLIGEEPLTPDPYLKMLENLLEPAGRQKKNRTPDPV